MPKEIAHILLAHEIRDQLPPPLQRVLLQEEQAYNFGCMSPDLFYYDFQLPWEKGERGEKWGGIIHGKDGEETNRHVIWMLHRARSLRGQPHAESMFSFVAGYLTHVALDIAFHPLVYSISGNYFHEDPVQRRLAEARHRTFESCLDLALLEERRIGLRAFRLLDRLYLKPPLRTILLEFYCDALTRSYSPATALYHVARRSLVKARFLERAYHSRMLLTLLLRMESLLRIDLSFLLNLFYAQRHARGRVPFHSMKTVPHPVSKRPYPADIRVLWKRSTGNGISFLNPAWDYFQGKIGIDALRKHIRPYSLNNGMEKVPTARMIHSAILPRLESWRA